MGKRKVDLPTSKSASNCRKDRYFHITIINNSGTHKKKKLLLLLLKLNRYKILPTYLFTNQNNEI